MIDKHLCHLPGIKEAHRRQKKGASSFKMHDSKLVFKELNIKEGDCFLDVGCGAGDYALRAAEFVGETGKVYALDRWSSVTDALHEKTQHLGINNIYPLCGDLADGILLQENLIDVCLIATLLHALDLQNIGQKLGSELKRVLKPDARLVTIDCKKENTGFGPPLHLKLAAEEVETLANGWGFKKTKMVDLGPNYMLIFQA